jgi:hypothetical protein
MTGEPGPTVEAICGEISMIAPLRAVDPGVMEIVLIPAVVVHTVELDDATGAVPFDATIL